MRLKLWEVKSPLKSGSAVEAVFLAMIEFLEVTSKPDAFLTPPLVAAELLAMVLLKILVGPPGMTPPPGVTAALLGLLCPILVARLPPFFNPRSRTENPKQKAPNAFGVKRSG